MAEHRNLKVWWKLQLHLQNEQNNEISTYYTKTYITHIFIQAFWFHHQAHFRATSHCDKDIKGKESTVNQSQPLENSENLFNFVKVPKYIHPILSVPIFTSLLQHSWFNFSSEISYGEQSTDKIQQVYNNTSFKNIYTRDKT